MNTIPTSEEFMNRPFGHKLSTQELMIQFAKLHVEECKEEIYNKGLDGLTEWCGNPFTGEGSDYLDKDSIINAYPLENIK